jgi:hypothetical protein
MRNDEIVDGRLYEWGEIPVLIRMSGEIRREVRYSEPLGGEYRRGREVERNEYSARKGTSATSSQAPM